MKHGDFISIDYMVFVHNLNKNILVILIFLSWMSLFSYMNFIPVLRVIGIAMNSVRLLTSKE